MDALQSGFGNDHDARTLDRDETAAKDDQAYPEHPVPAMQEAFEESIKEAALASVDNLPTATARERRRKLLEAESYDASWAARWQQAPEARCHPIVKLMAQIIFGLHLLHKRQAISETEVVKILQTHVDDIDKFLEKTTQDFDLANADIDERMGCLKLPMQHTDVFDRMLDDRKFRRQLVEGNEKIEKIIARTAKEMHAVVRDIRKTINTVQQLAEYLNMVRDDWPREAGTSSEVYQAMRGNQAGWMNCLRDLQNRGNHLDVSLVRLGTLIGEMNKMIASASQRARAHFAAASSTSQLMKTERNSVGSNKDKPLPAQPNAMNDALRALVPAGMPVTPLVDAFLIGTTASARTSLTKTQSRSTVRTAQSKEPRHRNDSTASQRQDPQTPRRPSRGRSSTRKASADSSARVERAAVAAAMYDFPLSPRSNIAMLPAPLVPNRDASRTRSQSRATVTRRPNLETMPKPPASISSNYGPDGHSQKAPSPSSPRSGLMSATEKAADYAMELARHPQTISPSNYSVASTVIAPRQTETATEPFRQHQKKPSLPDSAYEEIIIQPPSMFLPPITTAPPLLAQTVMKHLREPSPGESETGTVLGNTSLFKSFDEDLGLMGHGPGFHPQRNGSIPEPSYVLGSSVDTTRSTSISRPQTAMRSTTSLALFPALKQMDAASDRKPSVTFEKTVVVVEPKKLPYSQLQHKQSRLTRLFRKKSTSTINSAKAGKASV